MKVGSAPRPLTAEALARRRHVLARIALPLLPLMLPARRAGALDFPALPALPGGGGGPSVQVVSEPSICQARCRDQVRPGARPTRTSHSPFDCAPRTRRAAPAQDFVVMRYTGRFTNGTIFDARYADQPLTCEIGAFYLPGVDRALTNRCVGTTLQLRWEQSPPLARPSDAALLPAGSPVVLDVELLTIQYKLFGEKMRNVSNPYYFAPEPLTLTSAFDERGHASDRPPTIQKDNPFSITDGEFSIISNPTGALTSLVAPLFKQGPSE